MTRILLAALAASVFLLPPPAAASGTVTYSYIGPFGDVGSINGCGQLAPRVIGGGCFWAWGDQTLTVSAEDASGRVVGMRVTIEASGAPAQTYASGVVVCGSGVIDLSQWDRPLFITVHLDGARAPLDCGLDAGPATVGALTITVA